MVESGFQSKGSKIKSKNYLNILIEKINKINKQM